MRPSPRSHDEREFSFDERDFRRVCRMISEHAGIHLHPHRWRHSAAQAMLDDDMDREYVRQILGHRSLATLAVYTRATDTRRALDAHKRHSPMDRHKRR